MKIIQFIHKILEKTINWVCVLCTICFNYKTEWKTRWYFNQLWKMVRNLEKLDRIRIKICSDSKIQHMQLQDSRFQSSDIQALHLHYPIIFIFSPSLTNHLYRRLLTRWQSPSYNRLTFCLFEKKANNKIINCMN